MTLYWFWGEDDFSMAQAIERLQQESLDPAWRAFNYEKLTGDRDTALIEALNQALTPPFGQGSRLVWLSEPTITSSPEGAQELERTLAVLPETSILLLTSRKKPDGRSKFVKLVQRYGHIREFALIPPWRTEELYRRVQEAARDRGFALTPGATELIAQAVGNDTRQLENELTKLDLLAQTQPQPLDGPVVAELMATHNHSSLELVAAIRDGDPSKALQLVAELFNQNESPLRIVATLTSQLRLWLLIQLSVERGEKDERAIAKLTEISNPKRIYFIRREMRHLTSQQLLATLPRLLALEASLKRGGDPLATLQGAVVELCLLCQRHPSKGR